MQTAVTMSLLSMQRKYRSQVQNSLTKSTSVTLVTQLKEEGLMTRDPRMVERKKPGQPKARKKFQFSKR